MRIIIHPRVEVRTPAVARFLLLSALWFGGMFLASRANGAESADSNTFAALVRVHPHTTDREESDEARRKRLRGIAVAIDAATPNLDERAWLIMTATRESGLAAYVTEDADRCRLGSGGRCDGGRAFGAWQIHGLERNETKEQQAATALRLFRAAGTRCKRAGHDYWLGGIAGYARGSACEWGPAEERLVSMRAIRGKL